MTPVEANAERVRRHRLRRALGLIRVIVGDDNYSVPPAVAERVRRMCERATETQRKPDE